MSDPTLFGPVDPAQQGPKAKEAPTGAPRLQTANRGQIHFGPVDLEARLPQDHVARLLWDVVGRLDLSQFYAWIKARGSSPGRPAIDPKILLTLWLLATTDGVTSGNELADLCGLHDAYRWVCGGVAACDHVLTDFRTEHAAALDDLITQVLAVLLKQGTLTLDRVAHDGMRVRASAGAASFRREVTLDKCLEEAQAYLEHVKREAGNPANQWSRREAAAKERAARARVEAAEEALRELPKVKETKLKTAKRQGPAAYKKALDAQSEDSPPGSTLDAATERERKKSAPRVSTTDPDARVMKMADGGFRPAFNFQFATDVDTRIIVGVRVTNSGSDGGQLPDMLTEIRKRTGRVPSEYLVDGGFVKLEDIDAAEAAGARIYAPVPGANSPSVDPHEPKRSDGEGTKAWRQRMATPEAKAIYKDRAATAEGVNADLRVHRGLDRLSLRGLAKVTALGYLATLTYNLLRPAVAEALRAVSC